MVRVGCACLLTLACVYVLGTSAAVQRTVVLRTVSSTPARLAIDLARLVASSIAPRTRPQLRHRRIRRRLVLMALMCLVLGGLGGVLAATATRTEPAAARFIPPREAGVRLLAARPERQAHQPRGRAREGDRADIHLLDTAAISARPRATTSRPRCETGRRRRRRRLHRQRRPGRRHGGARARLDRAAPDGERRAST